MNDGSGDGMYLEGTEVEVVADIKDGYEFLNWELVNGNIIVY